MHEQQYNSRSFRKRPLKVLRSLNPDFSRPPCALTIGNFDGVHRGHQALLRKLVEGARARQLTSCVMTFEPHPKEFFSAANAPPRILNLRDKLEAIGKLNIDQVLVQNFNSAFAKLNPEAFVSEILLKQLNARWVLIGDDFCYGAKRAGNFSSLQIAGKKWGFEVESIATVIENQERISSSALRQALQDGNMEYAKELLGRTYSISGHVLYGQQLGRKLGFPTINLAVANHVENLKPATSGIFVAQVHGIAAKPLPAVASLGVRPSVDRSGKVLLEAHIFDFKENIYGRIVKVDLLKKLRDEAKYSDLNTLRLAIQNDALQAQHYFKQAHNV